VNKHRRAANDDHALHARPDSGQRPPGASGAPTLLLGLIGAGIQASRTPAMHEREAEAHGIRCLYRLLDLDTMPDPSLPDLLDAAERVGFAGVNVTHPCKQSVLAHLTELSPAARVTSAVNTIVFGDGKRIGHNTDASAFRRSFEDGLPGARLDRVVQLGAGGAGAATAYAALGMGVQRLHIVDTLVERARALCARLDAAFPERATPATRVEDALADADGLIHATPTGMAAHPGLPLPIELLRPELWVAEIVYFPVETPLLLAARDKGCRTLDGTGMALWQAVDAFRLFTKLDADPERMREAFARSAP
jgi:shikimate dehydrogenase